jgi:sporulation protein YlmC with PRC-barrel domain
MRHPLLTAAVAAAWLLPNTAILLPRPAAAQVTITAPPAGGAAAGEAPGALTKLQPTQSRASKLIGSPVYNQAGGSVGDIADLIIDRDGRVSAVVISVGGFLGMGKKLVALPMEAVKFGENDRLTVNLTRDQIAMAPGYSYGDRDLARSGSSGGGAGSPGFGAVGGTGAGGAGGAPGPRAP